MTADQDAERELARTSDQLASVLAGISEQARIRRATGFVVPIVDADPTDDSPTNVWLFSDGQLNSKTPDGIVHRYPAYDPATDRPAVPTFSANPAASAGWKLWFDSASGELRGYLNDGTVVRYAPITAASSATTGGTPPAKLPTSTKPKPADPKPKRYRRTYKAQWAKTYCSRHGVEGGGDLYYGSYPGAHGERKIMVGFDDGQIRSDLSGASIKVVELKAQNVYSWANSGITIHWGAHNKSSQPGSFSAVRKDAYVADWPKSGWGGGDDHWRSISTWFGTRFRDGDIRGLTIDQPGGVTAYGRIDWSTISLAITYVK